MVKRFLPVVVALLASSSSLAGGNPAALRASADRAQLREQFCDAAFLYTRLDEQGPKPDVALLAATSAAQGGDRAGAVAMLEAFLTRFPGAPQTAEVQKRLEAIRGAIAKAGPGATCAAPRAECGNGLVESGEVCDDGNRIDGDSCPATCAEAPPPPAAPPPPPPPPVVVPVVMPPPPPPPPPPPSTTATPAWATPPSASKPPPAATPTTPTPAAVDEPTPTTDAPPPDAPASSTTDTTDTTDTATSDAPADEVAPVDGEVVEPPAGPRPPIAGIILSGVGGVAAVGGVLGLVWGLAPAVSYFAGTGGQAAAAADYKKAEFPVDQQAAAGAAADARAAQVRDAAAWNSYGRLFTAGGAGAVAAGIGLIVGGVILISSNGAEPAEGDTNPAAAPADAEPSDDEER